jgi:hypothetical protein
MVRQKIGIEQLDGESIHGDTCKGEEIIDTPYTQLDRLSHCACSRIVAMSMVSLLHGILPCPLSRRRLVPGPVRLVQMRNIRHQRVLRVGIRKHRAD